MPYRTAALRGGAVAGLRQFEGRCATDRSAEAWTGGTDPERPVALRFQREQGLHRGGDGGRHRFSAGRGVQALCFQPGQAVVRVAAAVGSEQHLHRRAGHVDHHTRLPGYVAGRVGTVERVHGAHVFPDTHAHDLGEQPEWLYNVVFDATDLWADAAPGQRVSVDAWESYLSSDDGGAT